MRREDYLCGKEKEWMKQGCLLSYAPNWVIWTLFKGFFFKYHLNTPSNNFLMKLQNWTAEIKIFLGESLPLYLAVTELKS